MGLTPQPAKVLELAARGHKVLVGALPGVSKQQLSSSKPQLMAFNSIVAIKESDYLQLDDTNNC